MPPVKADVRFLKGILFVLLTATLLAGAAMVVAMDGTSPFMHG